jgi:hypothetical protein
MGPIAGAGRVPRLRGGGPVGSASAWRTMRRWMWWRPAICRIDIPRATSSRMMPNSRALRAAWDSAGDGGGSRRWLAGEAGEGEGERGAGAAADRGEPPAKADNRDEGWELFFYWADGTGMILFFRWSRFVDYRTTHPITESNLARIRPGAACLAEAEVEHPSGHGSVCVGRAEY